MEVDPGRVSVKLAADYAENPPERIAVRPFVDHSNARFQGNRIALTHRNYGEVLHYDAYYVLLVAAWDVEVKVQLARTGMDF